MRSPQEIAFRLGQEAANLRLLLSPPRLPAHVRPRAPLPVLPDPDAVAAALPAGTADAVLGVAAGLLEHRFPLLGYTVETGPEIRWRRDYINGKETGTAWFRRIPYLDFAAVGDHKVVWELNRHQNLVALAQAWRLRREPQFIAEIASQLESWREQNPYCRGINWASALEVAFRALSWLWVWHIAGEALPPPASRTLLEGLYLHGCYLRRNLSVYFSPNTHLLGEAVALHALGRLLPDFPGAEDWRRRGREVVTEQMTAQTFEDGAHFEKSSYYHVYALDFFLLHAVLETPPEAYRERLARMAEYLHALLGPARELPLLGDDDGGRVFHPWGCRTRFGRATLAACAAWLNRPDLLCDRADLGEIALPWLGPDACALAPAGMPFTGSRLFAASGLAVMNGGGASLVADIAAFGAAGAGHSHAHALAVTCRHGSRETLIDPGTFTYVADPAARARFRGTAVHNTLSFDGADQATAAGPFRWTGKPRTAVTEWRSTPEADVLAAECRSAHGVHRRRIRLDKATGIVEIADEAETAVPGLPVTVNWHAPDAAALACIDAGDAPFRDEPARRSRTYGQSEPSVIRRAAGALVRTRILLPASSEDSPGGCASAGSPLR